MILRQGSGHADDDGAMRSVADSDRSGKWSARLASAYEGASRFSDFHGLSAVARCISITGNNVQPRLITRQALILRYPWAVGHCRQISDAPQSVHSARHVDKTSGPLAQLIRRKGDLNDALAGNIHKENSVPNGRGGP